MTPRPFAEFSAENAKKIKYVLFDVDDTITTAGKLTSDAYSAMWRLHEAGIRVVPVTGRPAGWCDMMIRQWPAHAVVGENGAFAYYWDGAEIKTALHPNTDPDPQPRLRALAAEAMRRVPGSRIARDQFSRLYDVAVDFCEDEPKLTLADAAEIHRVFTEGGATAKISSIHVNAWFGDYSKAEMTRHLLETVWQDASWRESAVFFGDSPNDEPMFRQFPMSVGVANIAPFLSSLKNPPAYVTRQESGAGFAAAVEKILYTL